jgi:hypothetical protein
VSQDKIPSGIVPVNMNPIIRQILMSAPGAVFEAFLDLHVFYVPEGSSKLSHISLIVASCNFNITSETLMAVNVNLIFLSVLAG